MVLAKGRGRTRARLPRRSRPSLKRCRRSRRSRSPAPASSTCGWRPTLARRARGDPRAGRDYGRSTIGDGRAGQRRICLGQPDRADAHGPLPRRGRRRRARRAARAAGSGSPGILCQRCRRAGRYARPLAHLRYREALGEDDRRDSRRPLSRRLSGACRPGAGRRIRRPLRRRARERVARPVPRRGGRGDDRADPPRSRTARHPPRRVRVRGRAAARGAAEAARGGAARQGPGLRRRARGAQGQTAEEWEPVELPLFRSTRFGDDQDRPIEKSTAAGPISAPTSPITCRRPRAPTS